MRIYVALLVDFIEKTLQDVTVLIGSTACYVAEGNAKQFTNIGQSSLLSSWNLRQMATLARNFL